MSVSLTAVFSVACGATEVQVVIRGVVRTMPLSGSGSVGRTSVSTPTDRTPSANAAPL